MKSSPLAAAHDPARPNRAHRPDARPLLSRGLACLLLALCLVAMAATRVQADGARQATVEEQIRLQRIQQLFQLVDMAEQEAARRKQAEGRNHAEPDDREDVLRDIADPPRFPQTAAGFFTAEADPSTAEMLSALLRDPRIFGTGLLMALILALYFGAIRPALARRRDAAGARTVAERGQYAEWKRRRLARREPAGSRPDMPAGQDGEGRRPRLARPDKIE